MHASSLWLELFIRSSVLLAVGAALRRLAREQSASLRHTLLLGVFGLLGLLPVLAVFLPSITLRFWAVTPQEHISVLARAAFPPSDPPASHQTDWLLIIWAAGTLAALTPMMLGSAAAWRIARRAKPFAYGAFVSPELTVPLTCGFVRSRILLPTSAETWPGSRIAAVIAHERAHIRRRDLATQMIARVIAAVWWFQPLVWVAWRNLRAESELACDVEALRSGFLPSAYAAELLAIAQTIGPDVPLSAATIGMAQSGDLEDRLRAILNPSPDLFSKWRGCTLAIALATAAVFASASTLNTGGSTMKRTFASALLTSAGLSAATLTGSVHDASGAAVTSAKVIVYNPDTSAKQEAVTDSSGRFSVADTPAGDYILRIEKPGFTSILREYDLGADTALDRTFTMGQAGEEAVNSSEAYLEGKPNRVGGGVMEANLITKVQPVYPQSGKDAHIEGTVEITGEISKEGVPIELRVVSSPSDDLSQSALEAVRQWRYRPTLLNGEPVDIVTNFTINYTLAK